MSVRFVSFKDASTEDEAETFVIVDTGSAVLPVVGRTVKVARGFQVQVYSLDGHRAEPAGTPVAANTVPQLGAADVVEYERIAEALVEGDLREPRDFEGSQSAQKGWAPYNNPAPDAGK